MEGKKKTQNGVKRLAFTVLSILLEVVFLIGIFKGLNEYAVFIDNLTRIFAVILVLKIYGRNETSSMKTPWIILILTFPILGVALYFMIGMNGGTRKMRMRYKRIDEKLLPLLPENKEVVETPIEKCMTPQIAGKNFAIVPILRAGLGMVSGLQALVPTAKIGHIGLYTETVVRWNLVKF